MQRILCINVIVKLITNMIWMYFNYNWENMFKRVMCDKCESSNIKLFLTDFPPLVIYLLQYKRLG